MSADVDSAQLLRRAEALVGIPFIPGRFDCMHLAVRAQRQLFGREVGWPAQEHPTDSAVRAAWIRAQRDQVADRVPTDQLQSGDVLLFLQSGDRYHVGTYLWHKRAWLLHVRTLGTASRLEPLEQAWMGMRLEGAYRWRIVRAVK